MTEHIVKRYRDEGTRRHIIHRFREIAGLLPERVATRIADGDAWREQTYAELRAKVDRVAQGVLDLGLEPGDRVGLFANNCPEWTEVDLGVNTARGVVVPLYATSTPEQIAHIVTDSGMRAIVVGGQREAERVLAARAIAPMPPVVVLDDYPGRPDDVRVYEQLLADPTPAVDERLGEADDDDLTAIIYTSGTTGAPKGAMISHAALCAESDALEGFFGFGSKESSLCFLPLSHALERGWTLVILMHGCMNTYVYNPRTIAEQMVRAQATMMVSVPKLYEMVFATAHKKVARSPLKRAILTWALKVGRHNQYKYRAGRRPGPILSLQRRLADKLVYRSVRDAVGGPKHILACGGAPLRPEIEEFFSSVGLPIQTGYGLTEAAPLVTFNAPGAFKIGTVGRVLDGGEVRLGDLGELLYRGPNVMRGYWNAPEATAEAIDEDGWLHTGDVGYIDNEGYVTITDRLKDIIVTLGGKNVSPQPIEGLILADPLFEHAVLIGDTRPFVTLLVKPSAAAVEELAKRLEWPGELKDWLASSELLAELRKRVTELTAMLPVQDRPKETEVLDDEFTTDNGLLTPTLKVRRREVEKRFKERIDAMYERLEALRRGQQSTKQ